MKDVVAKVRARATEFRWIIALKHEDGSPRGELSFERLEDLRSHVLRHPHLGPHSVALKSVSFAPEALIGRYAYLNAEGKLPASFLDGPAIPKRFLKELALKTRR